MEELMLIRRIARHPLTLAVLVALLAAGCILSGQFTIVINIEDEIAYVNQVLNSAVIDLTTDETWKDHKDDIQKIIDVKFEVTVENSTSSAVTGEVYVSENEYTTAADVQNNATLVLSGIVVEANDTRTISFTESAKYITNLSTLLDLVEKGNFYIYALAADTPYVIKVQSGARLLVTFSAG
jgi:hypothetical protein